MKVHLKYIATALMSLICIQANCQVPIYYSAKGKWGYAPINDSRNYIIKPKFEEATRFVNGAAVVKYKGKYGIIDTKGKYIVNPIYDEAKPFSIYGTAIVTQNKKTGIVDLRGNAIIPFVYESISELAPEKQSPLLAATKDGLIYLLNTNGELLYESGFIEKPKFDESGLALLESSTGKGLISFNGQMIIPLEFANVIRLSSSNYLTQIKESNAFSIISISPQFVPKEDKYKSLISKGDNYIIAEKEDGNMCHIDLPSCIKTNVKVFNNYLICGSKLFDLKNGEISLDEPGLISEDLQGDHYEIIGNLISWVHDNDTFCFNTDINQFGIYFKGKTTWLPINATLKKKCNDLIVYSLNGNNQVMNIDGSPLFNNINIVDFKHLYKDYYALFSKDKWHICNKTGKVFDTKFDKIKDADKNAFYDSGYVSCDCSPGWYILFPIMNNDVYYVTGHFNYNEYGPFLDLNKGLYGLVNRRGLTIMENAHYKIEPSIPQGTRWISGTFQFISNSYKLMCTQLKFHPSGPKGGKVDIGVWQEGYFDWRWETGVRYEINDDRLLVGKNSDWIINSNDQTISHNGEVYHKVSD